jgi:hypothetical protein
MSNSKEPEDLFGASTCESTYTTDGYVMCVYQIKGGVTYGIYFSNHLTTAVIYDNEHDSQYIHFN